MPRSYYLDNTLINVILRGVPYTPPSASYVALFTTAPTRAGGGVEVTGLGYARQSAVWSVPVDGRSVTTSTVTFPTAQAPWGTVVAYAAMDAPTGGHVLYFATFNSSLIVNVNDQLVFPAGQLQVIEDLWPTPSTTRRERTSSRAP